HARGAERARREDAGIPAQSGAARRGDEQDRRRVVPDAGRHLLCVSVGRRDLCPARDHVAWAGDVPARRRRRHTRRRMSGRRSVRRGRTRISAPELRSARRTHQRSVCVYGRGVHAQRSRGGLSRVSSRISPRAIDRTPGGHQPLKKLRVAIIGSGNIGTDLMIKVLRTSRVLEMGAMAGIDPSSDGLALAARMGVPTTAEGIDGLVRMPGFGDIAIVFDATSAGAHARHDAVLRSHSKQIVDLTPAAIGPYMVPVVNFHELSDAPNVNMVSCGGQATIPMVAAISRVAPVAYAEIVASIASKSAGPGTRANIDEFTQTTARGIERVGGAKKGKAIIVLNPAEPPLMMRN